MTAYQLAVLTIGRVRTLQTSKSQMNLACLLLQSAMPLVSTSAGSATTGMPFAGLRLLSLLPIRQSDGV